MDDAVKNALRVASKYDTGPKEGEATLKPYEPTLREKIYQLLAGTEKRPTAERASFARGAADLAEFAPGVGNVMGAQEALRRGDNKGAALAMLPIPGVSAEARAAKTALEPAEEAAKKALRAYHYSPTAFEKFEMGHAGTGAGGTSFGHGGYWGAKEADARMWQDRINAERGLPKGSGHMYEVELKADPERMIDYNKYLHEQPEAVKDILINKLGYEPKMFEKPAEGSFGGGKPRGDMAVPQSEGAMKAWQEAGIHGVKYYDPNNAYSGYVTFDEDPATILRRYAEGGPVTDDTIERKEWSPFPGLKITPPSEELSSEPDIRDYQLKRHAHEFEGAEEPVVPRRPVVLDAPLFGGKHRLGTLPYNYAPLVEKALNLAYGQKTLPLYFNRMTAPVAMALDAYEASKFVNRDPKDLKNYTGVPGLLFAAGKKTLPFIGAGAGAGSLVAKDRPDEASERADGGSLPMRFPYGQRYNRKTDRLDAPDAKGIGFLGPLSQDDHIVSEYSSDRDIQYPSIYDGISPRDLGSVLMHERMSEPKYEGDDIISEHLNKVQDRIPFPRDVDDRAYDAARRRVARGQSPFFEQGKDKYPAWSPDQHWEEPAIMRSTGGAMNEKVKNALRLAMDGKYRLHQALARTGYASGGSIADQAARKLIDEIDELIPHRGDGGIIDPYEARDYGSDVKKWREERAKRGHKKNYDPWKDESNIYTNPTEERHDPNDPMYHVSPEEYKRGVYSPGVYALADGGRAGYATGGEPTDINHTDNPVLNANQPIQDPTRNYVQSLYQNVMGRPSDQAGIDYWTQQLNQGNIDQPGALQNFAQSAEFQNLYKNDPNKAVSSLYQTALGRAPDQAGTDYWVNQAKGGMKLGDMVSGFTGSDEGQNVQDINNLYQKYTGDVATPDQIQQAKQQLGPNADWSSFLEKTFPTASDEGSYDIAGRPVAKVSYNWKDRATEVPTSSEDLISQLAPIEQKYNLPPGYLLGMMGIESAFGTNQQRYDKHGRPAQYQGAFQLSKALRDKYNITNSYDWLKNADAAARYAVENRDTFRKAVGRDPTSSQMYGLHQQGAGGYSALAKRPEMNAIQALIKGGAYKTVGQATSAIRDNLPDNMKKLAGSISSADFMKLYEQKFLDKLAGPDKLGQQAVASWYEKNPAVQTAADKGAPTQATDPALAKQQRDAALAADKAAWEKMRDAYINERVSKGLPPTLPPELTNFTPGAGGTLPSTTGGSIGKDTNLGTTLPSTGAGGNVAGGSATQFPTFGMPSTTIPSGLPNNPGLDVPSWKPQDTGQIPGVSQIPVNYAGISNFDPFTGQPTAVGWDTKTGVGIHSPAYLGPGQYDLSLLSRMFLPPGVFSFKRGGVVKPDVEDVENALRLARRQGGRINTKIDKDPDFDMSVRLAKGGRKYDDGGTVDETSTFNESNLIPCQMKRGGGAWTRKEGQNPEGGLNDKGRASAKAEGHDLKPPAPHPKTDRDAARRKSFCARMKGMKDKLTSSETANDPDSRINKSLRVWNCHSNGGAVDNALKIAKGGAIWDKPRDKGLGEPKPLSESQKKSAKASAKAAGRPYPNLVDNMRAAQRKK